MQTTFEAFLFIILFHLIENGDFVANKAKIFCRKSSDLNTEHLVIRFQTDYLLVCP